MNISCGQYILSIGKHFCPFDKNVWT